jgi:hypothetical protein
MFSSNQAIGCAMQFITPEAHNCFSMYSAERQTLTLPKVKVTPKDVVFPNDKELKSAACYRATLMQGIQPPVAVMQPGMLVDSDLFTLISAEEIICQ